MIILIRFLGVCNRCCIFVLCADALRCPTEPVSMKGKPKLEEETWFSIPTDGKKVQPGEDMANPALLPGLPHGFNRSVGVCMLMGSMLLYWMWTTYEVTQK